MHTIPMVKIIRYDTVDYSVLYVQTCNTSFLHNNMLVSSVILPIHIRWV